MKNRPVKIDALDARNAVPKDKALPVAAKTKKNTFDNMLNSSMKAISNKPITFKKTLFNPHMPLVPAYSTADTGFRGSLKIVMKHEGHTYVKNDAMKGPSRMGILQSTAREYGYQGDIRNITSAQTEAIYKKIWDRSGAAGLPYPLSAIHFDTYVNSPAAARKILKQSGGDVDTYLAMREQRYTRLATLRPERFGIYRKGWMNRISSLRNVAAEYAKASGSDKIA
jgi:lysozyme family protein